MKGDFSRETFAAERRHSRVLLQQGRMLCDADVNELVALLLHHARTTATDVIGWHGTPRAGAGMPGEDGFRLALGADGRTLTIGRGHYYVDGILCENDVDVDLEAQPDGYPELAEADLEPGSLAYLDVWERHLTAIEDPGLRDVAFGGADTATRARVVWQVKVARLGDVACPDLPSQADLRAALGLGEPGRLAARVQPQPDLGDPCLLSPESRYRGPENQLYRVEVRTPGSVDDATFVWSRDNGAVAFPVVGHEGAVVEVEHLGRDDRFTLKEGDWVEAADDLDVLAGVPGELRQVVEVDRLEGRVTLDGPVTVEVARHALLRRWDSAGEVALAEGATAEGGWLALEDGVEVRFEPGDFRTGDHWAIPARTATGGILWPADAGTPRALPPAGIAHHLAPLACLVPAADGAPALEDRRRTFTPLGRL